MRIIRDRRISESHWRHVPEGTLADTQSAAGPDAIIVGLADWRLHKAELRRRGAPVGVRLAAGDALDEVLEDLESIALVALEFATFTEGRAYTQARRLRERHAFSGEIRAVGDVSRDRVAFMERCGFNAFELPGAARLQGALDAFGEISHVYQPGADARPIIASQRT